MNLDEVHKHSSRHKAEIYSSDRCGCFYCMKTFPSFWIREWVDPEGDTAVCPNCGVDAVLGSACGYPLTDELLQAMHARWFKS